MSRHGKLGRLAIEKSEENFQNHPTKVIASSQLLTGQQLTCDGLREPADSKCAIMATISTALGEIAAGGREALQGGAVREGERGRKEDKMVELVAQVENLTELPDLLVEITITDEVRMVVEIPDPRVAYLRALHDCPLGWHGRAIPSAPQQS
jgi:hypothetical protein